MLVEIRPEWGRFTNDVGHRVTIDAEEGMWHYGVCDRATIAMYRRTILRRSTTGGTIIEYDHTGGIRQEIPVAPCPTGHANVVDDFMGGTICKDCSTNW